MKEELKQLKDMREGLEVLKSIEEDQEAAYKATTEYQSYTSTHEMISEVKHRIELKESEIREEVVELSRQTGFAERHFGAVQIKEFTKVEILDHKQAVVWAAANAPSCLTLTRDFDKAAKSLELPFVQVKKEYHAQIATDLAKYVLEDENADNSRPTPEVS